ncbi:glycosyltransferase [uncultured Desulfobacter sp.]|uniref:glycosyltransferase n=1 Tax=uncultured Desulfobacter sp. TaxID=240139 RepID=UPI0029F50B0B|nr:glycosyltransferase [uncultured Desulfobacter sp.]
MKEIKAIQGQKPFVSVIIPCYNDECGIRETLATLSGQDYPPDRWEVIVVDNNSTDHTTEAAEAFRNDFPVLNVLNEKKQSSYAARNKGIANAKGDIFAFIDADMTVQTDWISFGVSELLRHRVDYLGCKIQVVAKHKKPNSWERYELCSAFPIRVYMEEMGFTCTASLMVTRHAVEAVGRFDDRLLSGGDLEFGNRVRDNGLKMYYCRRNIMKHPARNSMKGLYKKTIRVANGHADLKKFYPARYKKLTLTSVISGFIPILRGQPGFRKLNRKERIRMGLVQNFFHYCESFVYLKRYIQEKDG